MKNFTIYTNGKYDIKANMSLKLEKVSQVLDQAQVAFFVEHRIGRISLDGGQLEA